MEESRLPSVHDTATCGRKALFLNSNLTASHRRLTTNCRISLSKSGLADFTHDSPPQGHNNVTFIASPTFKTELLGGNLRRNLGYLLALGRAIEFRCRI